MQLSFLLPVSFVLALATTGQSVADAVPGSGQPTGRIIVNYEPADNTGVGLGGLQGNSKRSDSLDRKRWRTARKLKLSRHLSKHTELLQPSVTTSPNSLRYLAQSLQQNNPRIRSASLEYKRYTLLQPNDPLFQGNLSEPGNQDYLYDGSYSMRAPGAWDITTGTQNEVIAIVDTGILPNHPDLLQRTIPTVGYDFVSADQPGEFTSANDGDGRDNNPQDPGDHCHSTPSSWHGTSVASVAAATANNNEGIAGIDWNARLLHARALGRCGGTDADIIDAIRWSAGLPVSGLPMNNTPATVINLSIGGPTECTPAWQQVIDELELQDIPFVIAAGNETTNALRSSPANCANVITVGSNTPTGDLDSSFSNYGLKVTVSAPGRNILAATNRGVLDEDLEGYSYHRETGSSFSAALVSGAISLMQSLAPNLSPAQIRHVLQQSATAFSTEGECNTYYCGSGILSVVDAVKMVRDGQYSTISNQEQTIVTAQLTELTTAQPLRGSLFGYRDIRYFKITTEQAGMLSVISESDVDLFGYLLNDQFSVLNLDDDSHTSFNFRISARVPAGDYYLAVERSVNNRNQGEAVFDLIAQLNGDQPAPFNFTAINAAAVNTSLTSSPALISGLSGTAIVAITGGFYSINGGEFTSGQGMINNGDRIAVSLQSAPALNTQTSLTLTVGAYATEFSVTTGHSTNPPPEPTSGCTLHAKHPPLSDPTLLLLLICAWLGIATSRKRAL